MLLVRLNIRSTTEIGIKQISWHIMEESSVEREGYILGGPTTLDQGGRDFNIKDNPQ